MKLYFKNTLKFNKLKKNKVLKNLNFKDKKKIGGLMLKKNFKKDTLQNPLISIIMPNFKSKTLKSSILSVLKQSYKNIEIIVVDGNSGSSTVKVLKRFEKKIDLWISDNDKGLWDAWNKGYMLANGRFVGIVDSSNKLYPNAMKILSKYIKNYPNIDFVCGTVKKDGRLFGGFRPDKIYTKFNIIPSSVVGFFIKNSSLKKVGYLNLKYKIQADYDLLYRMIIKFNFKGINSTGKEVFGDLGNSGFSKKYNFFDTLFNEIRIRNDNGQNKIILLYIIVGKSLTKLFNFIF